MLEFSEKQVSPHVYDHNLMSVGSAPAPIRVRGHLVIEAEQHLKRAKRYFFVLQGIELLFLPSADATMPLGKFHLGSATMADCELVEGCDDERRLLFRLSNVQGQYFGIRNDDSQDKRVGKVMRNLNIQLQCPDMAQKERWMAAIEDNVCKYSAECEGYLFEKGQRQYYKLADGLFGQYSSAREKKPVGSIRLLPDSTTVTDHGVNTFSLLAGEGSLRKFEAENSATKLRWLQALETVIHGHGATRTREAAVRLSARIIGTEVCEGHNQTSYTQYILEVSSGAMSWIIRRRFSEFASFQENLKGVFPHTRLPPGALEVFKTKTLFGSMRSSLVRRRRALLQSYLSAVLAEESLHLSHPIQEFFETRSHLGTLVVGEVPPKPSPFAP